MRATDRESRTDGEGGVRTTWTARAASAVLVLALTGCGASGGSDASGTPTTTPTGETSTSAPTSSTGGPVDPADPTSAPVDGCPYLTEGEVTDALGAPTVETAGTLNACFFDPVSDEGAGVMVSRVDVQIDPTDYARQTRVLCQGDVTDVEAGDDAFVCVLGLGPQGQVYLGRALVTINVTDAADDATGLQVAAELLPLVTVP